MAAPSQMWTAPPRLVWTAPPPLARKEERQLVLPRFGCPAFSGAQDDGEYSVFELLGDDPVDIGDRVSWVNDTGFGSEPLTNRAQRQTCEVYVQYHHVSQDGLADALS